MEKIDKRAAGEIAAAAEEALTEVAEKFGLEVKFRGGKYDPQVGEYHPKFVFSLPGSEEREFARVAWEFGLSEDDFGTVFTSRGEEYRLKALSTRRPKYPVVGERVKDGKLYKFPEKVLEQLLSKKSEVV